MQWTPRKTRNHDMHRTGRHGTTSGPDRRRCLTPAETQKRGTTTDKHGFWGTAKPQNGPESPPVPDLTA